MKTPAMMEEICRRIEIGQTLQAICEDPGMPERPTVNRWMREDPEFSSAIACARKAQAWALGDEVIEMARNAKDRNEAYAADVYGRRVEWYAARLNPAEFAPRQQVEVQRRPGTLLDEIVQQLPAAVIAALAASVDVAALRDVIDAGGNLADVQLPALIVMPDAEPESPGVVDVKPVAGRRKGRARK